MLKCSEEEKRWKQQLHTTLQKTVAFYGDELVAIRDDGGQVFVSLRHMCQALGLNVQAQRRRVERHTVMKDGFMVAMMATIKGKRPSHVLRVDLVPLWLSGVDASRVKDELRAKLEQYQREAAKVLWESFQDGRLSVDSTHLKNCCSKTPMRCRLIRWHWRL